MPLPGTVLANKALKRTRLAGQCWRLYTQARKNDRTHKIFGVFSERQAERLIGWLGSMGASNPRAVRTFNYYTRASRVTGVRFEMPTNAE